MSGLKKKERNRSVLGGFADWLPPFSSGAFGKERSYQFDVNIVGARHASPIMKTFGRGSDLNPAVLLP
jgi:hypothetical protein